MAILAGDDDAAADGGRRPARRAPGDAHGRFADLAGRRAADRAGNAGQGACGSRWCARPTATPSCSARTPRRLRSTRIAAGRTATSWQVDSWRGWWSSDGTATDTTALMGTPTRPAGSWWSLQSSYAAAGFYTGERPPAQWINYQLHFASAWADYLAGPGWGAWTRVAHGGSAPVFTSVTGLAVDTDDTRAGLGRYRYVAVGAITGPAAAIGVSRTGREWLDRDVPTGCDAIYGVAVLGDRCMIWGCTAAPIGAPGRPASTWAIRAASTPRMRRTGTPAPIASATSPTRSRSHTTARARRLP